MELTPLTREQLRRLYDDELVRAFPSQELKPLKAMYGLMDRGRYEPLGLFEDGALLGYALMWLEPGVPFALLDYLGTLEGLRGQGLGSRMLDLLSEHYAGWRGVFGEAEAPESGAPEGEALRRRRLAFYDRNGFRYGGYDCALFGVHYRVLIRGPEDVTPEELLKAHRTIYQSQFSPALCRRFIQIPLAPGESVRSGTEWLEG